MFIRIILDIIWVSIVYETNFLGDFTFNHFVEILFLKFLSFDHEHSVCCTPRHSNTICNDGPSAN